jgi:hypothetical protein
MSSLTGAPAVRITCDVKPVSRARAAASRSPNRAAPAARCASHSPSPERNERIVDSPLVTISCRLSTETPVSRRSNAVVESAGARRNTPETGG